MPLLPQYSFWEIKCYTYLCVPYLSPGYCDITGNCRVEELATTGVFIPESFSIDLPHTSFKLAIERKFFQDANLFLIKEESCSTARLTWRSMGRKRTNELLGLGRNTILITVAMLTCHFVMGRHAEEMRIPFNDCCLVCRPAEKEDTVINFLCQCPSLARCKYRLFGSPTLVSLTELSSIDVKDKVSFIKLSD